MSLNLKYDEFEKLISSLTPFEFEKLIFEILISLEEIEEATFEAKINNRQIDIVAIEKNKLIDNQPVKWIVEIKKYKSLLDIGMIEQFYAKTLDLKDYVPNARLLLVASSGLTKPASTMAAKLGITVWGLPELLEKMNDKVFELFFSNK